MYTVYYIYILYIYTKHNMVIGPIPAGYSNQFAPLFVASSRTWSYHIPIILLHIPYGSRA